MFQKFRKSFFIILIILEQRPKKSEDCELFRDSMILSTSLELVGNREEALLLLNWPRDRDIDGDRAESKFPFTMAW